MAHERIKNGGLEKKPFLQLFSLLPSPPPPPPPTPPSFFSHSPHLIDINHPKTIPTPSPLLWRPPMLLKSADTDSAIEATPIAPPPKEQSPHQVPNHEILSFTEKSKSLSTEADGGSTNDISTKDAKTSTVYSGSLSSPVKVFDKVFSKAPSVSPTQQDSVVSITVSVTNQTTNVARRRGSLSAPPIKRRQSTSYTRNNSVSGFTSGSRRSSGTQSGALSVPIGREKRTSSIGWSSSVSSSQSLSVPNSANGRRHSTSPQRWPTPTSKRSGSPQGGRPLSKSSSCSGHRASSVSSNCGFSFITDKRACGLGHSKFHHVTLRKLSSCPDSIGDTSSSDNNNKRMILKSSSGKRFWFRSQNSIILSSDRGFYSILDFKEVKCHWEIMKKRRSCLRLLLIVIRIRLLIKESKEKQTFQNKPQTLAELNYYSQYTAFSTKTMTFNKAEFAQKTSCNATIPLWARFAMEEDPESSKD
uniref:Uncharacterized protein n=1 Tax=Amphimedon queenslandica TaxID=400682 RepID=A0A1X7U8K6_AMPQE